MAGEGGGATLRSRQRVRQSAAYSPGGVGGRTPLGGATKRAFDIVLSSMALLLLAPLLGTIWVLLRATIGNPVIRSEKRIGLRGKPFALYSFRMDAWSKSAHEDAIAQAMRASGVDRLPQLYNVLRGDMSFVGPELAAEPATNEVLMARPGMMGMRHHVPRSLRRLTAEGGPEACYVRHWSMWLDLKIACGALTRIHAQQTSRPTK